MSFVRVPPDGAGKRVEHRVQLVLGYTNGLSPLRAGDIVVGATSGLSGVITKVIGTTDNGTIHVQLDVASPVDSASAGEDLEVGGVPYAKASGVGTPLYSQALTAVGANNSHNGQNIDEHGSAFVRFAEGAPTVDAFGNIRVGQAFPLGYYDFVLSGQSDLFWDEEVSGGAVTHDNANSLMVLSTNTTGTSSAVRTSNRYHFYQPGISLVHLYSIAMGDTGKANNSRGFGPGDASNGLFWALDGTALGVVVRSNTSGTPVDIRVEQEDFNVDRLDGTGLSGFTLDVSARNVYWIDYAWLGAGPIRFGVFGANGERVVAHRFNNSNGPSAPYTKSGSFPIHVWNTNTGVTSSTSEIRLICAAVVSQSKPEYVFWRFSDISTATKEVTEDTPCLSIRPKTTYSGNVNRVSAYPETLSVFVSGGAVKLTCYERGTIDNATWDLASGGPIEGDEDGSAVTADPSDTMFTYYLGEGAHNLDISKHFELTDEGVLLGADGTTQTPFSFLATKLSNTTVTVAMTLTYRELS